MDPAPLSCDSFLSFCDNSPMCDDLRQRCADSPQASLSCAAIRPTCAGDAAARTPVCAQLRRVCRDDLLVVEEEQDGIVLLQSDERRGLLTQTTTLAVGEQPGTIWAGHLTQEITPEGFFLTSTSQFKGLVSIARANTGRVIAAPGTRLNQNDALPPCGLQTVQSTCPTSSCADDTLNFIQAQTRALCSIERVDVLLNPGAALSAPSDCTYTATLRNDLIGNLEHAITLQGTAAQLELLVPERFPALARLQGGLSQGSWSLSFTPDQAGCPALLSPATTYTLYINRNRSEIPLFIDPLAVQSEEPLAFAAPWCHELEDQANADLLRLPGSAPEDQLCAWDRGRLEATLSTAEDVDAFLITGSDISCVETLDAPNPIAPLGPGRLPGSELFGVFREGNYLAINVNIPGDCPPLLRVTLQAGEGAPLLETTNAPEDGACGLPVIPFNYTVQDSTAGRHLILRVQHEDTNAAHDATPYSIIAALADTEGAPRLPYCR